jgi:hypothetical protein
LDDDTAARAETLLVLDEEERRRDERTDERIDEEPRETTNPAPAPEERELTTFDDVVAAAGMYGKAATVSAQTNVTTRATASEVKEGRIYEGKESSVSRRLL